MKTVKRKICALVIMWAVLLVSCAPAISPDILLGSSTIPTPVPNVLFVDPGVKLGSVSPYLLGSNYGPWVAVPANRLDAAYDSNVKSIRFPGGAWGDRNTLKPYQIDSFMAFCQKVGAIPTISVNLRDGTPEEAAELVRYVNVQKKYGVVYWSIGNEPTLFAREKDNGYDTVQFNSDWRKFAEAVKAVDPSIKLIGPELHQYAINFDSRPKDDNGLDWMDEFLKANGDMVDVVTFHRYPFGTVPARDELREDAKVWNDLIVVLRERIHELTGRDIPIAITEVSTNYNPAVGGDTTPDSHFNAVWLADVMGQMAQQRLLMFNHWMLASSGSGQGGWGMIARDQLRPSYHVYQMYSMFGTELVYSSSDIENVNIYAASRDDGTLTLMITNLNDQPQTVQVQFKKRMLGSAHLFLFDPEHELQDMGSVNFPDNGMITLTGESVSLYVIEP